VRHAEPSDCKDKDKKTEAYEEIKAVFDEFLSIEKKHGRSQKEKEA